MTPYILGRCAPEEAEQIPAALLGPRESAASQRLRVPKRRRDWLAGRIAAKRAAEAFLDRRGVCLEPTQVEILNAQDGSPYVSLPEGAGIEPPAISISHSASGGVAVLADGPVGVDLESSEKRPAEFLSLMAHQSERTPGLESDPVEQTRLWTVKEAVSKLLGVGFSVGFWDIRHVPAQGGNRLLELHGPAQARWRALGSPEIRIDTFMTQQDVLSVAYTPSGGNTHA